MKNSFFAKKTHLYYIINSYGWKEQMKIHINNPDVTDFPIKTDSDRMNFKRELIGLTNIHAENSSIVSVENIEQFNEATAHLPTQARDILTTICFADCTTDLLYNQSSDHGKLMLALTGIDRDKQAYSINVAEKDGKIEVCLEVGLSGYIGNAGNQYVAINADGKTTVSDTAIDVVQTTIKQIKDTEKQNKDQLFLKRFNKTITLDDFSSQLSSYGIKNPFAIEAKLKFTIDDTSISNFSTHYTYDLAFLNRWFKFYINNLNSLMLRNVHGLVSNFNSLSNQTLVSIASTVNDMLKPYIKPQEYKENHDEIKSKSIIQAALDIPIQSNIDRQRRQALHPFINEILEKCFDAQSDQGEFLRTLVKPNDIQAIHINPNIESRDYQVQITYGNTFSTENSLLSNQANGIIITGSIGPENHKTNYKLILSDSYLFKTMREKVAELGSQELNKQQVKLQLPFILSLSQQLDQSKSLIKLHHHYSKKMYLSLTQYIEKNGISGLTWVYWCLSRNKPIVKLMVLAAYSLLYLFATVFMQRKRLIKKVGFQYFKPTQLYRGSSHFETCSAPSNHSTTQPKPRTNRDDLDVQYPQQTRI